MTNFSRSFLEKIFLEIKIDKNKSRFYGVLAGVERIELPSTVLETGMLPLYHTPSTMKFYHSDADFAILILNFV